MKKFRILIVFVCLFSAVMLAGCGSKDLPPAQIVRDDARTGGSLSFVYDKNQRKVFVGGEEEVVQFSMRDESRDLEEGCRVGLKVIAPDEKLDFSNATLEMNGVNYSSGDFLEIINGQKQNFFVLQPLFSKETRDVGFKVTWADGTKEQEYRIIILEGTKFMGKNGEVK